MRGARKSNTNGSFIDVVVKQWFTVCVSLLMCSMHCTVHNTNLHCQFKMKQ